MKLLVCFLFAIHLCVPSEKYSASCRIKDLNLSDFDTSESSSEEDDYPPLEDKGQSSEEHFFGRPEINSTKNISTTTNSTSTSATPTAKHVPTKPINKPTTVATIPTERTMTTEDSLGRPEINSTKDISTTTNSTSATPTAKHVSNKPKNKPATVATIPIERTMTTEDVNIKNVTPVIRNQIPKPERFELSPTTVYVLGTMLIIMFIVILFLIYYLFKRKHKEYRMYTGPMYTAPDSPIGMQSHRNNTTQELREVAPRQTLQLSDSRNLVDTSEIKIFKPQKETVGLGTKKAAPSYDNEMKTNRTTSKVGTNNNVIPREKILQICKDALRKHRQLNSESTKDLNKMFQELSAYDSISSKADDLKKKSASTSMLDVYDVPQGLKIKSCISSEFEESPVYQNPLSASTRHVDLLENDTQYLMPLSGETKMTIEPTYINAYYNR